jgi:hypothetical protein
MTDLFVNAAWRAVVLGLMLVLGMACILMGYGGVLNLIGGNVPQSGVALLVSIGMGCAAFLLAKYRCDLVDEIA